MLGELLKGFSDYGVVRRKNFFVNVVPKVLPNFVAQLLKFASRRQKGKWSSECGSPELEHGDVLGSLSSNLTTLFSLCSKSNLERV